jgi:hypothetical protein
MNIWVTITLGLLLAGQGLQAQGFINLNFELAKIVPVAPYSIAVTNALPGWDVTLAGEQATQITFNNPSVGAAFVTLWATNGAQISGNFSAVLTGGIDGTSASISQTALVPVTEHSLLFEAQPGFGSLIVLLG